MVKECLPGNSVLTGTYSGGKFEVSYRKYRFGRMQEVAECSSKGKEIKNRSTHRPDSTSPARINPFGRGQEATKTTKEKENDDNEL